MAAEQNGMGRVSQQWDSISTLNWVGEAVSVKSPKLTCSRILEKYYGASTKNLSHLADFDC